MENPIDKMKKAIHSAILREEAAALLARLAVMHPEHQEHYTKLARAAASDPPTAPPEPVGT